MIDGANARRQPQPFRRVRAEPGIENCRARHQQRMAQRFLDLGPFIGDAGRGREFAAGDRGRRADLADGGRFSCGEAPRPALIRSMSSGLRISLARHSCTALAPSVMEPPPTVTMRSASAARACSAGGDHRRARRVRRHRIECADAARPHCAADVLDHVGFAVERAADHQERAFRAQPVHLLDDRLGCRSSEHDLVHGAEYDTPCDARLSSPDILALCPWLHGALAARLAEEIRDVMPQDDAVGHADFAEEPAGSARRASPRGARAATRRPRYEITISSCFAERVGHRAVASSGVSYGQRRWTCLRQHFSAVPTIARDASVMDA